MEICKTPEDVPASATFVDFCEEQVSFVFTSDGSSWVVPHGHPDFLHSVSFSDFLDALPSTFWVWDKKRLLHEGRVPGHRMKDARLSHFIETHQLLEDPSFDVWSDMPMPVVPASRLFERALSRFSSIPNFEPPAGFDFYNGRVLETLQRIESEPLCVDLPAFRSAFGENQKPPERSSFNMFTKTGRPSNTHRGVNLAALTPKQARSFVSGFGKEGRIVSFDYDAFHLRMLAWFVGYEKAPFESSFHRHLGQLYLGKEELTDEEYETCKKLTFQVLYQPQGIPKELLELEFFRKVKEKKEALWQTYENTGQVHTPIAGRLLLDRSWGWDMAQSKMLSYFLQSAGVECVLSAAQLCFEELEGHKSRLVHYLYDSLVFDVHKDEFKEVLPRLRSLIEFNGRLWTKVKQGKTFADV